MQLLSSSPLSRFRMVLLPALAIFCLTGLSTQAHAACGSVEVVKGSSAKMPLFPTAGDQPLFFNPTVIGLWHAIYTDTSGAVFNDSFKSWHVDGTEVESAFLSPGGGNVCMGVWKQTDFRTVKLHHTGWLYNVDTPKATATNYFTVDEVVTVAPNGKTYTGTFTFKVWTFDGTAVLKEVTGTIAATRITV
jgi:uncharacterized protein (DUF2147 family)